LDIFNFGTPNLRIADSCMPFSRGVPAQPERGSERLL
jgi:hypothetical protein